MLKSAALKVSLTEPTGKFLDMVTMLQSFGVTTIHLIHIASGSEKAIHGKEQRLEALAEKVRARGFHTTTTVERGHIPSRTIAAAHELDADLLGLYWLPKALLAQAILGCIDTDIVRLSDLPVFVYNRRLMSGPTQLKRVLYATDFQATDAKVMPYLTNKDFAAQELFILHVGERAPDPTTEHARQACVTRNLERLAGECAAAYGVVKTLQKVGNHRTQILRQANAHKADLIVIGKADSPKPLKNLMGSTAETIADRSRRSVFIVPGPFAG